MFKTATYSAILTFVILASAATIQAAGSYGQYGQYGQYGGGQVKQSITIDKTVARPVTTKGGTTSYVDNLSPNDPRFAPGATVYFRIKVKNTSNTALSNINITDFVPAYVDPAEGPGNYDSSSRKITYVISSLNPGEERVHNVLMKVVDQSKLPTDKGLMCLTNKVQAVAGSASDDDSSQFCVEKQVVGAKQVPTAGPEFGLLFGAANLVALAGGIYLKKRS